MTPDSSVKTLRGVGETRAKALENMGIRTLRDLLYHFPRAYENRGHIRRLTEGTDGVKSAFLLTVGTEPKTVRLRGRMTLTKFKAFDDSGSVDIVFYNQEYVRQIFKVGETYRFWGRLAYSKSWSLSSPVYEPAPEGKVLPDFISVYSIGNGINRKLIESLIASALACPLPDFLPEEIRLRYHFPTLSRALKSVHSPASGEELDAALRRLIFDELFCYSLAVSSNRQREQVMTTAPCSPIDMSPFYTLLPYELTGAQKRVISEIVADMTAADKTPMHRILIGDVGSGKTVCAMAAIYLAVKNGYQAALMAPTEILANQHYQDFLPFFEQLGFSCACLTGSSSQREKKEIYARLSSSESDLQIVVGTHALLGDKVRFSKLGLVITDEQHRFGIRQRTTLGEKTAHGHSLVMSATPIPRTLALAFYGDLDVSRLDELPQGRQKIETYVVNESYRDRLNGFIARQVSDGGQVYIVCPAIEDAPEDGPADEIPLDRMIRNGGSDAPVKNAIDYAKHLQNNVFPTLRIGVLHGKMKAAEKNRIMTAFLNREIDILVSTTVIEVGVNVPNACLMVIENAERFGLSQLHQLRGRVGRGTRQSYCILVSDFTGDAAKERLGIMHETNDGFRIAERDLAMRGPGDFFSGACNSEMRQSGGIQLRLAKYCDDPALMEAAFREASEIVRQDPALSFPEHAAIKDELTCYFHSTDNEVS